MKDRKLIILTGIAIVSGIVFVATSPKSSAGHMCQAAWMGGHKECLAEGIQPTICEDIASAARSSCIKSQP